jgi:hypothetical protein
MRALLLAAALSVCCGYSFADSQPIQKDVPPIFKKVERPDKSQNNSNGEQPISVQPASSVNITVGGKLNVESKQNNPERNEELIKWSEWLVAIFTGLLVVVTGYLVRYTKKLWSSTSDLVTDAKDTSKKELRSYVSSTSKEMHFLSDTVLRAEVEFRNSGRTPAHKFRYAIIGGISPPNEMPKFVYPKFGPHRQPIAPNAYWSIGYELHDLTEADIQDIITDRKLVYIWGHAEYHDIFGKLQTIKFRYRNVVKHLSAPNPKTGARGITHWSFYPEEDGNEVT